MPHSFSDSSSIQQETDRCVKCGLCLAVCPTYSLFRNEVESPRGRLALIENDYMSDKGKQHLNNCLLCKRCESSCPSGVSVTKTFIAYRKQHNTFSCWVRFKQFAIEQLLLNKQAKPLFKLGNAGRIQRNSQQQTTGKTSGSNLPSDKTLLILPGCAAKQITPETIKKAARLLQQAGYKTETDQTTRCCGALSAHHGNTAKAAALSEQTSKHCRSKPYAGIVHLATGCASYINQEDNQLNVQDISFFLQAKASHLSFRNEKTCNIALHTPCSANAQITEQWLKLLKQIPNSHIQQISDQHGCCGAAGSFMLTNPTVAQQLRQPITESITEMNIDIVASPNIGCALHLQSGLKNTTLLHPIDILYQHLPKEPIE